MYKQPYDNSMKAMLKEDAAEMVPQLLPDAIFLDALDIEVLPAVVQADQVYRIIYRDLPHILHLEFQADSDTTMPQRLLQYHVGLLEKYDQPVISMVIYLFECATPTPPLRELSGTQEILTFYYQVLKMWTIDVHAYLEKHAISLYSLLPTMHNADASVLLQALDELIVYYNDNEAKLVRRLLWFKTFLERVKDIKPQEKEKVRKRLDLFDKLLEESEFVQRHRALAKEEGERIGEKIGKEEGEKIGKEEGEKIGKEEGEISTSQQILLDILQSHYSALAEQMETRILRTTDPEKLRKAIKMIFSNRDEESVVRILDFLLA